MQKVSDVKEKHTLKAGVNSFKYAINGVFTALAICRNLKIHYLASILAIVAGFHFEISSSEFAVVLLTISMVICLEMMNTAIERVVDLLTEKRHLLAMIAKDVAAGAVLISAVVALIIGWIIFWPYVSHLFR